MFCQENDAPMTKQDQAKRCMDDHRWSDAIPILHVTIADDPDDPWNLMYLGSCHYELRDYSESLRWFERASEIDGGSATSIGLQADAYHVMGDMDRAKELYQRAVRIDPASELVTKNWERFLSLEKRAEQDR